MSNERTRAVHNDTECHHCANGRLCQEYEGPWTRAAAECPGGFCSLCGSPTADAVAQAVKERDALADRTPLTDDQHVHTFDAVQCYWCVEREKERKEQAEEIARLRAQLNVLEFPKGAPNGLPE